MATLNFEKDVLKKSQESPVVVDFWAPWCGPCQVLGPVIEELARQAKGKWTLVKINTDENPQISQQFGIRGIPAVKMFVKGKVIAEFTGSLPKPQIAQWLEDHIPSEEKNEFHKLRSKLFTDEHEAAVLQLEQLVQKHPELEEANLWLAAATVGKYPERAAMSLRSTHKLYDLGEHVKSLAEIVHTEADGTSTVSKKINVTCKALEEYDYESAIVSLIEATAIDKSYQKDLPRRASIALFALFGQDHPLTRKYRRQFDMSLY